MSNNSHRPCSCSIGIYTGEGASHSWTWFVETLERCRESVKMVFLEENDIHEGALTGLDMLMIGGGDVHGMAVGLGSRGAEAIDSFVEQGGNYLGSCAGAYLVMEGINLAPYTPFNLIDADMSNYSVSPPPPRTLPHKYKVPYGGGYVYHSAYGPVKVAMQENDFLYAPPDVVAPLYGGPVIVPGEEAEVLARYLSLEKGCFPLVDDELIISSLVGGCAGACAQKGKGRVYIFGPHFECPSFPDGFNVIEGVLLGSGMMEGGDYAFRRGKEGNVAAAETAVLSDNSKKHLRTLKGELSNSRIVAYGLERMPVTWTIGTKVWEPEKVRYFIEFAWQRLGDLAAVPEREGMEEEMESLAEGAVRTRMMVRQLRKEIDNAGDTTALAGALFNHLKRQTVKLLKAGGR